MIEGGGMAGSGRDRGWLNAAQLERLQTGFVAHVLSSAFKLGQLP